jgi:predicted GIY-YIG superfamily endonuclease
MHFTHVLFSETDGGFSAGTAGDPRKRLEQHAEGRVPSTASRRPLRLISSEAGLPPQDADRRERDLKTGKGSRGLRPRIAVWLTTARGNKLERL